jgi:enoyl-CoA hydratase/carnithine racemase
MAELEEESVVYSVDQGVATIELNRPEKLNAFHLEMYESICSSLARADQDDAVRVIILRGRGRAFCTGRDLKYSADLQERGTLGRDAWRSTYKTFVPSIVLNRKMVIALVHGYAIGGGAAMAMAADMTIAAEGTMFGYPETRHGTAGKSILWPWHLGLKRSKELLVTGRLVPVEDLERRGLVNYVVPQERLGETGQEMALEVASAAYGVPELVKRSVNWVWRDIARLTYLDRLFETETADWDAAGVEPSPWAFSAKASLERFALDLAPSEQREDGA